MSDNNGYASQQPNPVSELRHRLMMVSKDEEKLALHQEFLPAILTYNLSHAMEPITEALKLAKHLCNVLAEAWLLRHLAAAHLLLGKPDSALQTLRASYEVCKILWEDAPTPERRKALAMATVTTAELYSQLADYDTARKWYKKAIELYPQEGMPNEAGTTENSMAYAALLEALGRFHSTIGDYKNGLEYLLTSLSIREKLGHMDGIGQALMALGHTYFQMSDYNSAHTEYQRSIKAFKRSKNRGLEVLAIAGLAAVLYRRGDIKEAIEQALKAYPIHVELKDWKGAAELMTTIGNYYESIDALDPAFGCYTKAYWCLPDWADDTLRLPLLLATGRLHARRKEIDAALLVLRWGLQIAVEAREKHAECDIHKALAEALEQQGQYQQALQHYKSQAIIQRELADVEQRRIIAMMQAQYAVSKAERERDASLQRLAEFEKEMETKRLEVIEATGQLAEKDSRLRKLPKIVERLRDAQGNVRTVVARKLIEDIECCIATGNGWKLFEFQFHSAYPDFLRKIKALAPSLTPRELQICFLAKLDRHTSTMATTLNLQIEGIEGHIRNIRKKFGLSRDDNFWRFIAML